MINELLRGLGNDVIVPKLVYNSVRAGLFDLAVDHLSFPT